MPSTPENQYLVILYRSGMAIRRVEKSQGNFNIVAITPTRKGDPLGLGIVNRPAAPEDAEKYDESVERLCGTMSIMTVEQLKERDELIKDKGFVNIKELRKIIVANTSKESLVPDPEVMVNIDSIINYKVFIVDNTVYTREEMFDNYAFLELDAIPEDFFARQLIGVFEDTDVDGKTVKVFIAKDEDDESLEFVKIEDLLRNERIKTINEQLREEGKPEFPLIEPRIPSRVVKTKIFIAKETFKEFLQCQSLIKTMLRVKKSQANNPNPLNMGFLEFNINSSKMEKFLMPPEPKQ